MTGAPRSEAAQSSGDRPRVVLDTNVLVAAGFARDSASARIVRAVRGHELRVVWNNATRREIEHIIRKIPPLRAFSLDGLFREEYRLTTRTEPERFAMVPDPEDREFAALAHATGAALISNDDDLLAHREGMDIEVLTPGEFWSRFGDSGAD